MNQSSEDLWMWKKKLTKILFRVMPQIEGVYARCHSSQEKASKDSLIISNVCCYSFYCHLPPQSHLNKTNTDISQKKCKFKEIYHNKDWLYGAHKHPAWTNVIMSNYDWWNSWLDIEIVQSLRLWYNCKSTNILMMKIKTT